MNANDGEKTLYFATKRDAMREARRAAAEYAPAGENVEVEEVTLVKLDKAAIVRLVNGEGGFVEDSRVIATLKSKRKEGQ